MPAAPAEAMRWQPLRGVLALSLTVTLGVPGSLRAQDEPVLRAICVQHVPAVTAPALEWLIGTYLRQHPQWPSAIGPDQAIALTLSERGLTLAASTQIPPADCVLAGSVTFADGSEALWSCDGDGVEDWFLPLTAAWPAAWPQCIRSLQADVLGQPRSLDAAVLVGHLTAGSAEGDPAASLMRLGAAACGEVTWSAWRTKTHLRVRGRSDGGLLLPALLVHLALRDGPTHLGELPLRAFVARDGDREEAARQLVRAADSTANETLRALLRGADDLRLVAIDTLVRRRQASALPHIVAAATRDRPLASLAAYDAVHSLFAAATPIDRQRTRAAIAQCSDRNLRSIDVESLLPGSSAARTATGTVDDGSGRARALLLLLLVALALYGLWSRERAHAQPRAS